MLESFRLSPPIIALIASAPGIVAWWTGRSLSRLIDDPALPELLMARQQRLVLVVATSAAIVLVLGGSHAVWGLPLSAMALLAGLYPLRRALLFESAGIAGYLWRGAKSITAGLGFWALLACTPLIVLTIDERLWLLSLGLLPVLLLWENFFPELWLRLHGAVPFEDETVAPRIEEIVRRAGIAAPDLHRIGAPGTRFVNALALPSLRRPAIVLGNALPDLLEPDETAAIYAHELSHIEQFGPRVLRRLQAVTRLVIVLAVGTPAVVRLLMPGSPAYWLSIAWPLVIVAELARRARKSQQRETESDLRAAALCGDAETVARALIKLHVHAFIPRRRPIDLERGASHPSLARRIQALRGEGDQAVAEFGAPRVLPTARDGTVVVFDDARAWWFDGITADTPTDLESLRAHASSMRSVAWSELVELRVATKGTDRSLRAVLRNGDSWSVPLASSQVAAMQKALDLVDVRLHPEVRKRTPIGRPLIAAATLLAMLLSGQIGILLVPLLLVLARPGAAALAALGGMAIGRTALVLVLGLPASLFPGPPPGVGLALLGGLGVAALALAWRQAQSRDGRDGHDSARITLYVLGATGSILLVLLGMAVWYMPQDFVDLPLIPALAVTLLGLGVALATGESRTAKRTGAAVAAAAVLVTTPVLSSAIPRESGAALARTRAVAVEIGRVDLAAAATQLQLSPAGSHFLVQRLDARSQRDALPLRSSWLVGSLAGARGIADASHVAFLDDALIFVLRSLDASLELSLEHADSAVTVWTAQLPLLWGARLVVSPGDRTWAVVGDDARTDSLLVLSGTPSSADVQVHRFPALDSLNAIDYLVFDDGARLIVPVFATESFERSLPLPLLMLAGFFYRTELWELTGTGLRRSGELRGFPRCGPPEAGRTACLVQDRSRSRIWALNSAGEAAPMGEASASVAAGTIGPGLRLTVVNSATTITDVDLSSSLLTEIELPPVPGFSYEAGSAAGRLVVLRHDAGGSQLVFFRVDT